MPPPASWCYVIEDLTGLDSAYEWARAAGVQVAVRQQGRFEGPTLRELFQRLLPDTGGLPAPFPEQLEWQDRRRAVSGFRMYATHKWSRIGFVKWETGERNSLHVGPAFTREANERGHPPRERERCSRSIMLIVVLVHLGSVFDIPQVGESRSWSELDRVPPRFKIPCCEP